MNFDWPQNWQFWQNFVDVTQTRNYILMLAYFNSSLITAGAVAILILFGAMVGYVLQRRQSGWNRVICGCVLAGLIIPPEMWVGRNRPSGG